MSQQSNNILDFLEEDQNANTPIWSDFLNITGLESEPYTIHQTRDNSLENLMERQINTQTQKTKIRDILDFPGPVIRVLI